MQHWNYNGLSIIMPVFVNLCSNIFWLTLSFFWSFHKKCIACKRDSTVNYWYNLDVLFNISLLIVSVFLPVAKLLAPVRMDFDNIPTHAVLISIFDLGSAANLFTVSAAFFLHLTNLFWNVIYVYFPIKDNKYLNIVKPKPKLFLGLTITSRLMCLEE